MNIVTPRYALVQTQLSLAYPERPAKEWIFQISEDAFLATQRFNAIVEEWEGMRGLTYELRNFLKRYPWHFEAMSRYSQCKIDEGRTLDGYAYAHTAVSLAKAAFPEDFKEDSDEIPGGFVENRPFLRCLKQLMTAQALMGDLDNAAATGFRILGYDREDRTGTRMELPKHLLKQGRSRKAVALFEDPAFEGTFDCAKYLYPIALLDSGAGDKARDALDECLGKPRIAKYLLNPELTEPDPEEIPVRFGIASGSELEGFLYAAEIREFWNSTALELLAARASGARAAGWPAFYSRQS